MIRTTMLLLVTMCSVVVMGATPSGANAPYAIQTDVLDAGGQLSTVGTYSQIGSFGGIEGLTAASSYSVGHGYIAQIQTAELRASPVVTVSPVVMAYSPSVQTLLFTATLVPTTGSVNEGTVTFSVTDNGNAVGSMVLGSVTNNIATASFSLPPGQAPNTYRIDASFSGGPLYSGSIGSGLLTVNKAVATIAFDNLQFVFTGNANVVTATTTPVGLNYTITYNGIQYPMNKGPIGFFNQTSSYNVEATVQDSNYSGSASGVMTIFSNGGSGPSATTTTSAPARVDRSPSTQNVVLTASVNPAGGNGAVNEGVVVFKITDANNVVIGSPITSSTVSGGNVSVSYPLPAALALGTYTITATFGPSANFLGSSDTTHQLTVTKIIGGIVPNVRIDSISRNPARTTVPVSIVATGTTFYGQPLTFTWSLYMNGQATTLLRTATPALGQSDTLTTTFATEGAFTVGVVVDDGYNPDSGAAVTIVTERLKPNDTATPGEINIATGKNDRPSVGANFYDIQIGDSLQGVIDADVLSLATNVRTVNAGAFCINISGRNDKCNVNPYTAFKFTNNEAEIFVIQATDKVTSDVLGQRMVAIGQDEIEIDPAIIKPNDRTINVRNLKATFNFGAKKRVDSMAMGFDFKAPGGVGYSDSHAPIVLMGIGNVVLKFKMAATGKLGGVPTKYPGQSPVTTQKATFGVTGLPRKSLTTTNQVANATLNMSGANLVDNGFKFLGITNTATTVAKGLFQ